MDGIIVLHGWDLPSHLLHTVLVGFNGEPRSNLEVEHHFTFHFMDHSAVQHIHDGVHDSQH